MHLFEETVVGVDEVRVKVLVKTEVLHVLDYASSEVVLEVRGQFGGLQLFELVLLLDLQNLVEKVLLLLFEGDLGHEERLSGRGDQGGCLDMAGLLLGVQFEGLKAHLDGFF